MIQNSMWYDNFNVHMSRLEFLIKCRLWFSRSGTDHGSAFLTRLQTRQCQCLQAILRAARKKGHTHVAFPGSMTFPLYLCNSQSRAWAYYSICSISWMDLWTLFTYSNFTVSALITKWEGRGNLVNFLIKSHNF